MSYDSIDFKKVLEDFKNDPTIKSISAYYQPDGCPELKIERFENSSIVSQLNAVAMALKGCKTMEYSQAENCIRIALGEKAVDLANELWKLKNTIASKGLTNDNATRS